VTAQTTPPVDANDPRAEYGRRIDLWNGEIARGDRTFMLVSNSRLALALVTAVVAWQAFVSHRVSGVWPAALALLFAGLVVVHARVSRRIERARRARQLYERGMARLDSTWAGSGPDGARFLEGHPFAHDIDLFGPDSLFQLLDTARTEVGEETVAAWLGDGAEIGEVQARQRAVAELAPKLDFREELAVLAAEAQVARTGPLSEWAASSPVGLFRVHRILFGVCALVSVSLLTLVFTGLAPSVVFLVWVLVQSGIVAVWRERINTVASRIDLAAHDLDLMSSLLDRIEREPFASARLAAVHDALAGDGHPPSRRIARLKALVSMLDQATINPYFRPIGALLLVRSQMAVGIDRWHAVNGRAIPVWLRAVGDVEALSALGTYHYEHPADPFPVVDDQGANFDAADLAHPLIDERVAVRNSIALGRTHPRALIVSGSNMSGKSTLLRAVGVNVVLALAGAPVRAASMSLSRLALGATLRVDDSLQAGHSRFYAEILRIRTIVDLARGARPLLFLLDEILGGTNSYDRRVGAEAIVRALVHAGAIGLVTTHDLALTELEATLGPAVANVHFEDRIENGSMVFDYRMRPGVVERSNAVALMRAVGLDV
jgi:MutS domain V